MGKKEWTIDQLRCLYRQLRKEGSELSLTACDALEFLISGKWVKDEFKGLHPYHKELILMINKSIRSHERKKPEINAFKKIKKLIKEDDLLVLKEFYALPKSKECDETWNRKTTPTILMNSYVEQLEKAYDYLERKNQQVFALHQDVLPEPKDWKERVVGNLVLFDWIYLCKNWPEEAKKLQNPIFKMQDEYAPMEDFEKIKINFKNS